MTKPKLTLRQLNIIQMIFDGKANKTIASDLCISTKTVVNHRARIYELLNVHCTADLIRQAVKLKLITMEGEIIT